MQGRALSNTSTSSLCRAFALVIDLSSSFFSCVRSIPKAFSAIRGETEGTKHPTEKEEEGEEEEKGGGRASHIIYGYAR